MQLKTAGRNVSRKTSEEAEEPASGDKTFCHPGNLYSNLKSSHHLSLLYRPDMELSIFELASKYQKKVGLLSFTKFKFPDNVSHQNSKYQ